MTTTGWIVAILSFAVALVLGFAACTLIRRRKEKNDQRKIEDAEQEALRIVNEAIKSSENKKREALLEAKEEILKNRSEYEKEVKERRAEQQKHAQCDDPSLFHMLFFSVSFSPPIVRQLSYIV